MKPNRDLLARDLGPLFSVEYADETKRKAYDEIKPAMADMEQRVLEALRDGEKTDAELAKVLGFGDAVHRVTKQRHNLVMSGQVVKGQLKVNPFSGKQNQAWRVA